MGYINLIRWLKDVVEGLGATTLVVQTEVVRGLDFKKSTYLFSSTCYT